MSDTAALLNALKDIQEPLAPASTSIWLISANALAIIVIICLLYLQQKRRKEGWRREALLMVDSARVSTSQSGTLILAKVLRQIVLMREGIGIELDGYAWLRKLDEHFSTTWFSSSSGQIFGSALYRSEQLQPEEYLTRCDKVENLIKQLPRHYKKSASGQ